MFRVLIIFFILNFYNPVFSSTKEKIISQMQLTNNLSFNFIQIIDDKNESGKCIIKYPKKIWCEYDNSNKKIIYIKEKPKKSKSKLAVTGLYLFDNNVVNFSKKLRPSKRGELEIVDLLNLYKNKKELSAEENFYYVACHLLRRLGHKNPVEAHCYPLREQLSLFFHLRFAHVQE